MDHALTTGSRVSAAGIAVNIAPAFAKLAARLIGNSYALVTDARRQTHPQAIGQYHIAERRDRADRK